MSDAKIPPGWKLVPIEPTDEMLAAANGNARVHPTRPNGWIDLHAKIYRAMLTAAPAVKESLTAAPDDWLDVMQQLVREIERDTCMHEDTHRGGAIWEICDRCGATWADDEGGKPELKWPECVEKARAMLASRQPTAEQSSEVALEVPSATMFHDAGAIAQCGKCSRYTLDRNALSQRDERQPVCDCGAQHYWSGSFKPPGADAKWFGAAPQPTAPVQHADDAMVDKLAAAMKAKMAKQRAKGYGGWDDPACPVEHLQSCLLDHIAKGDPVDVANFCGMLLSRGEPTAAQGLGEYRLVRDESELAAPALDEQAAFEDAMADAGYPVPERGDAFATQYLFQRDQDRFDGFQMARAALQAKANAVPITPAPEHVAPTEVMQIWDIFSNGEWWACMVSPLGWDAQIVKEEIVRQGYSSDLMVAARKVISADANPVAAMMKRNAELEAALSHHQDDTELLRDIYRDAINPDTASPDDAAWESLRARLAARLEQQP